MPIPKQLLNAKLCNEENCQLKQEIDKLKQNHKEALRLTKNLRDFIGKDERLLIPIAPMLYEIEKELGKSDILGYENN